MQREALSILLVFSCIAVVNMAALAGEPPCQDTVRAEAIGSTIQVCHDQAEWNCCATIVFELVQAQDTFNLYECEIFESPPCDCICCFDLKTEITDVVAGEYLVRVLNGHTGELFGEVPVTVETDAPEQTGLGTTEQSPCGGWTIGVEEEVNTTWGRIKTVYR